MSSSNDAATAWLLTSDPAVRWQVMRDLQSLPESSWASERALVETTGWGARLLSHQDPTDGQWGGGAFLPAGFGSAEWKAEGQPWTATCFALSQLREFGLDPGCARARRTADLVGAHSRWDEGGQPFWDGETEECINGRTVADGAYFGKAGQVRAVVERLLSERQPDGGWNCERANGSKCSSFATTLNVLEGLLEFERAVAAGGDDDAPTGLVEARKAGEEYLLKRGLFRRLTTGDPADPDFLRLLHPSRWRYDVLRALDYFRDASLLEATSAGGGGAQVPDPRLAETVEHVRSKRREDGTWDLDWTLPGRVWFDVNDGPGKPSPWITLRAMRVLKWWDEGNA